MLINIFLDKLKNYEKNYEIFQLDTNKDDVFTNLSKMVQAKDIKSILGFWENALNNDFFELPHPDYAEINTRAVFSVQLGMANYILMLDKKREHPWVLAQCENIIDMAITVEKIIQISSNINVVLKNLKSLGEKKISNLNYNSRFSGFLLTQTRPFHFFYDHLMYFYALGGVETLKKKNKNIYINKSFFIPRNSIEIHSREGVFFFPSVIAKNSLPFPRVLDILHNMEDKVFRDVSLNLEPQYSSSKDDLIIWFGITGQKRSWLQQVEGCIEIITHLGQYFSNIKLYIDGMTGSEKNIEKNKDDIYVFEIIKLSLSHICEIHSLIGYDYRTKIKIGNEIDLFIANNGTGCLVPLRFCKKNGVLHSSKKFNSLGKYYVSPIVESADESLTIDVSHPSMTTIDAVSYHIPWQHIYNLAANIIMQTKDIDIQKLSVPEVEEVVKKSEKNIDKKEKDKRRFTTLKERIKKDDSAPDILREVAFLFEESGDLVTAERILAKANILRPEGKTIENKLFEYRRKLLKDNHETT